ncbi:MAG: sulfatase-like hydrolase/transferase [Verrucomicrobiales bacterium]
MTSPPRTSRSFLAVGFIRPHLPFVAPGRYYDRYPADSVKLPDNYYPPEGAPPEAVHNSGELRAYFGIPAKGVLPADAATRDLIRGYYAATSYTDAQIGRLLDAYDDLGLKENTIIVLWGDHGWNLGEHTMWCKHSCFETSMRAAHLRFYSDSLGIKAGAASQSLYRIHRHLPHPLRPAALPKPDHLQGDSLAAPICDPSKSGKGYAIGIWQRRHDPRRPPSLQHLPGQKRQRNRAHALRPPVRSRRKQNVAHAPEHADAAARRWRRCWRKDGEVRGIDCRLSSNSSIDAMPR